MNRSNEVLQNRYEKYWRRAMIASVLFHIVMVLLFRTGVSIPLSPFAAAGPRAGDDRAAAGGGQPMEAIAMRIVAPDESEPEPEPKPPVPEPLPSDNVVVVEEVPEPEPVQAEPQPLAQIGPINQVGATSAGADAPAVGPGIENGTGRGDGGTTESGLFRLIPPAPRGLILPPSDRPGKVRGKEVAVWVFVTDRGRVVEDSTRIQPGTGDNRFDRRLRDQAAEWVFEPAKKGGLPVAEWFRYVLIL